MRQHFDYTRGIQIYILNSTNVFVIFFIAHLKCSNKLFDNTLKISVYMYVFLLKTTILMSKLAQILGKKFNVNIILSKCNSTNSRRKFNTKTITAKPNLAHIYGKKLKAILSHRKIAQMFSYNKNSLLDSVLHIFQYVIDKCSVAKVQVSSMLLQYYQIFFCIDQQIFHSRILIKKSMAYSSQGSHTGHLDFSN